MRNRHEPVGKRPNKPCIGSETKMRNAIVILSIVTCVEVMAQRSVDGNTQEHINYDSLKTVLEKMLSEDQNIRRVLIDSVGLDSPEAPKYFQKMANIDFRNRHQIEIILDKYGWLEKSKVGDKASEAIFYIVQHTDLSTIKKYFPQFKKLAERDEASTRLCAMMEDRMLMWEGKKQIYGSQASNELRPDKSYAIWPIENPSEVNVRRQKAGFQNSIEESAAALKASFDPNEKLPSKNK